MFRDVCSMMPDMDRLSGLIVHSGSMCAWSSNIQLKPAPAAPCLLTVTLIVKKKCKMDSGVEVSLRNAPISAFSFAFLNNPSTFQCIILIKEEEPYSVERRNSGAEIS